MTNGIFHEYTSAVNWLETLIKHAYEHRASDIHIDPYEKYSCVRLRIDGNLSDYESVSHLIHNDGVGRLKILSHLRTDEHMAPQDGRFRVSLNDSINLDIRISIMPSYFGESVVLRLLYNTTQALTLTELGMSESDQQKVLSVLNRASGMILVTGPTGSGKTTTLYTLLQILNDGSRSIITIEDPIEYAIPGIRQIQTNQARGLTFASGLRSIVRQDPDVIMVGEIRDTETANIAIHTALTGHLLLSTLHTSDAATAIPRLIDMGAEPYLIASTLGVIISQRLIRKLCTNQSSQGRIGIFEVLAPDENVIDAVMKKSSAQTIKTLAVQNGMRTMENDGLDKAERDTTSLEEVLSSITT